MEIRPAETIEDLRAIYRFRYKVYVEEMGRIQMYADRAAKTIVDPLDVPSALVLGAWDKGVVVGTIRNNFLRSSDIGEYFDYYALAELSPKQIANTSITTRLMVHPEYRRSTLAARLSCATYRWALERGIVTDFIDCNAPLIDYFSGLGYRLSRPDLIHPEYGIVQVMRLDLTDRDHIEAVRSPFRKTLRAWNRRTDASIHFQETQECL